MYLEMDTRVRIHRYTNIRTHTQQTYSDKRTEYVHTYAHPWMQRALSGSKFHFHSVEYQSYENIDEHEAKYNILGSS